jgi:hypothetical protein
MTAQSNSRSSLRLRTRGVPGPRVAIAVLLIFLSLQGVAPANAGAPSYRPDAWIKLCGAGDTCRNAPPHRYRGQDVHNHTGASQTVPAGVEEQNDIRFWILFQNDGSLGDTFYVQGCRGNGGFVVRAVLVGAHTQSENATNITSAFKRGTAHFTFQPTGGGDDVVITLDVWARTTTAGVGYTCPITVSSGAQPSIRDTVVAQMHTCLAPLNCARATVRRVRS